MTIFNKCGHQMYNINSTLIVLCVSSGTLLMNWIQVSKKLISDLHEKFDE